MLIMLTKGQINILNVFKNNIFEYLTIKQIKKESKQKSNNVVQIALCEFQKYGIIKTKKTGNVKTYCLNLDENMTISYLNLINEFDINKSKLPVNILSNIQKQVFKYTEFFILAVFGSFAKNKSSQKSDLDIAVIVETENTKKEILPYLETIKRRELISIDYHIFTRIEFLEMINTDYENLGKQIYKVNLIYYGYIQYLNLIKGEKNE